MKFYNAFLVPLKRLQIHKLFVTIANWTLNEGLIKNKWIKWMYGVYSIIKQKGFEGDMFAITWKIEYLKLNVPNAKYFEILNLIYVWIFRTHMVTPVHGGPHYTDPIPDFREQIWWREKYQVKNGRPEKI